MADDGLLMNFEVGEDPIVFKSAVKGGDWKQRRSIKKRLQDAGHPKKDAFHVNDDLANLPQPKRPRTNIYPNSTPQSAKTGPLRPHEVISSLFSFNPTPTSVTKDGDKDSQEKVSPSNAPLQDDLGGFTSLGLSPIIASHLSTKLDVKHPTAIQNKAIPRMLQDDSDVFIQAQTGSGKTLAYLLPLLQKLTLFSNSKPGGDKKDAQIGRHSGLFAIVLAPTRELAKQISVVLENLLGCAHWLVSGAVIGGEKKKSEKARLRRGLNILIATPGRLVDHLNNTEALDVSHVRWLILDEGDRLMELGFEEDIKAIVEALEKSFQTPTKQLHALPPRRTTILCSATMRTNVQRLGEISLKDAIHIRTDAKDGQKDASGVPNGRDTGQTKFSAPAQLKQSFVVVPSKQRLVILFALLRHSFARKGSVMKAIVFLSCADSVEFHFMALTRRQSDPSDNPSTSTEPALTPQQQQVTIATAPTLSIPGNPEPKIFKLHGSLVQSLRTTTLTSFAKAEEPSLLLCTDVASRGLDLPAIDLIIEYDPAFSAEDHLHRIGRTARAGRDGRATVFLLPGAEESYISILKDSYKEVPAVKIARQDAEEVMKRGFTSDASGTTTQRSHALKRAWEEAATEYQLEVERWVLANNRSQELARKAYISHVRAYATHVVPERHIFDIKNLHLGHLAKAFGLREPPTNMGHSRLNAGNSKSGKTDRRSRKGEGDQSSEAVDRDEARRKMREVGKTHMNAAAEFNIG